MDKLHSKTHEISSTKPSFLDDSNNKRFLYCYVDYFVLFKDASQLSGPNNCEFESKFGISSGRLHTRVDSKEVHRAVEHFLDGKLFVEKLQCIVNKLEFNFKKWGLAKKWKKGVVLDFLNKKNSKMPLFKMFATKIRIFC